MPSKPYEHNIYIAGPMRGIKDFNFPAFYLAAVKLKLHGWNVFNPAERDVEEHGDTFYRSETGSQEEIEAKGFSIRDALHADTAWICNHADAVYLLRGWENSKGAVAEKALAEALNLKVYYE